MKFIKLMKIEFFSRLKREWIEFKVEKNVINYPKRVSETIY